MIYGDEPQTYCEWCGGVQDKHEECEYHTTTCPSHVTKTRCLVCKSDSEVTGDGESDILECDTCFRKYLYNHDKQCIEHHDRKGIEDNDIEFVIGLMLEQDIKDIKSTLREHKTTILRYYRENLGELIDYYENISK